MSRQPLNCNELVEIVTDYLEGALPDADRDRFEEHVAACAGCANYLDQIKVTIEVAGRITADDLPNETKSALLAAFRNWNRE